MNASINICARIATLCCSTFLLCGSAIGQQPPAAPEPELMLPDPEVLDAGPVHEAFAEPLALDAVEFEVVPKQPPEPIQEIPPEVQPEGRNVQWIPGYFLWDQDRKDFVWVSGLWRDVPPGRIWIPGEWQEVEGGWQRVPGFWADEKQEQLALLPVPPDSLDEGPSSPAPGENYLWAPGCWVWQQTGYAWQAGYWYQANPNWVWIPNHYCFTPRGAIFVSGYWDFLPARRGWLYAPVYWGRGFAGYGGTYFYRPRYVVNSSLLTVNLFINRGYNSYYFGYGYGGGAIPSWLVGWGNNYSRYGYYHGKHAFYDPWWNHANWHHHGNFPGARHRDNDRRGNDHIVKDVKKTERKLIGRPQDFEFTRTGFNGKGVRHLTANEANEVRKQVHEKYQKLDRNRIGLERMAAGADEGADPNGRTNQGRSIQGRVLRQNGQEGSSFVQRSEQHRRPNYQVKRRDDFQQGGNLLQGELTDRSALQSQRKTSRNLENRSTTEQANDFRRQLRSGTSREQMQQLQNDAPSQSSPRNQLRSFNSEDLARRQAELRARMLQRQTDSSANLGSGSVQNGRPTRNFYRAPTRVPFAEQQGNSAGNNLQQRSLREWSGSQQRVFRLPANQGSGNPNPSGNIGGQQRFQPRAQSDNSARMQSQQNFRPSNRGAFQGSIGNNQGGNAGRGLSSGNAGSSASGSGGGSGRPSFSPERRR